MDRKLKIVFTLSAICTIALLALNWWFIKIHPASIIILVLMGGMMFATIFLGVFVFLNKNTKAAPKAVTL